MKNPFEGKEIWFLTGSQGLYGEETLLQVAAQSQTIAEAIDAAGEVPIKVVWKPVLKDSESIKALALAANADENCIGLIAWMHTFSPAKMWIRGLDALDTPLLHLHTQANVELPWADINMDFMNLNQAAHGDREFGYIQTRMGVPRKTVVGHVSNPTVIASIATWTRAAAGFDAVRNLRLARFGDNMRNVAVTEGDKTEAEISLGVSVNTWGVNDLVAAVDAVEEVAQRLPVCHGSSAPAPPRTSGNASCAPAEWGHASARRRPWSGAGCRVSVLGAGSGVLLRAHRVGA